MKTIEQINKIKTLKSLIAEVVNAHKSTKKVARQSSNDESFDSCKTANAQVQFAYERVHLYVLYTYYYALRHEIIDFAEYAKEELKKLTPVKAEKEFPLVDYFPGIEKTLGQTWYGSLEAALLAVDKQLNQFIEMHKEG